jgi:adenylate cyclase
MPERKGVFTLKAADRPWVRGRLARMGQSRVVALCLLLGLIALRAVDPSWLELLRHKTFDTYQLAKPRIVPQNPVVIVDIDERSLKDWGQWPWPRTLLATLVQRLAEGGATTVVLDAIFAEVDRLSPGMIAGQTPDLDEVTRAKLKSLPSNEAVLAAAMKQARVVVAQAGQPRSMNDDQSANSPQTSIATLGGDPRPLLIQFPGLLRNRPEIEWAAAGRGLTTFLPERDGVIRRVPAIMVADDHIVPSLAIEALRVDSDTPTIIVRRDQAGVHSLVIASTEVATDSHGQLWLHHARHLPARFIAAADVLSGIVPPERIRGKIALIGSSSVGLFDLKTTPLERVMPGVELHAQVIENIVSGGLLIRPHNAIGAEIAIAAATGLAVIVLAPMLGALPVLLLSAATAAILAGGAWYLFDVHRILIDVVYPLLSSSLVLMFLSFQNYMRTEFERNSVRKAFAHYLSPTLVEELAHHPEKLQLGGETRMLTIYRSDLAGFSGLAERLQPHELVALMNEYLGAMSDIIIEHGGFVDKYIGDAIDGVFGAPLDHPDHALRAVKAAIACQAKLREMNEADLSALRGRKLRQRIGLHTGEGLVGNIGSRQRFNYTVMGDIANLASRLEGANKFYGTSMLTSEATARLTGAEIVWRELDIIQVVGRAEHVRIFEPLAHVSQATQAQRSCAAAYAEGLSCWRSKDFAGAVASFERFSETDLPSRLFQERAKILLSEPPAGGWVPVNVLESK